MNRLRDHNVWFEPGTAAHPTGYAHFAGTGHRRDHASAYNFHQYESSPQITEQLCYNSFAEESSLISEIWNQIEP